MIKISQQFAPPFRLIAPFFISALVVYIFSALLMFGFDANAIFTKDLGVLAFVHLFLLGFVMMAIFGAMAQLVPVVLEVEHFAVELYYVVYPLLLIGTFLMVSGFYFYPVLLSFGGLVAFIAFGIFMFETFATLSKVKKLNFVSTTVLVANIFLLLGIIVGFIMALGYGGFVSVDLDALLKVHVFSVLFGYVGFTVMGLSYILIPMFWLSHSFDTRYLRIALSILAIAIISVFVGEIFDVGILSQIAEILLFVSFGFYFYELFLIYKTRARIQKDIYYYYMVYFAFGFGASLVCAVGYYITQNDTTLVLFGFSVMFGMIAPMILGHLYKIVPFLVWFERFSPLVGKQKIPMLADMIPVQSANLTLIFNILGFVCIFVSLMFGLDKIFGGGVSFLVFSAVFLLKDVLYMVRFR
ncbi:MAG: hypothetical protein AB1389_04130 [Campylobacterota bacterium]